MKSKIEIEFKWSVKRQEEFQLFLNAAKALGASVKSMERKQISDLYFDTPDKSFKIRKTIYRLRRIKNHYQFTIKTASQLKKGLAKRSEKTFCVGSFKRESDAIHSLPTIKIGFRLAAHELIPLFRIQNRRTQYVIHLCDRTRIEICFDKISISRKQQKIKMLEIEAEFIQGCLQTFYEFIKQVSKFSGLKHAKFSKVATAVNSLNL